MDRVIVHEFGEVENIRPKTPTILFQRLICSFCLSICLRVVNRGEVTNDLEHFEEVLLEFRDELRSTVIYDTIGETMMPTYLTHDSFGGFFTSDFLSTWQEMGHLRISITSNPSDTRRFVMKSRAMDCHDFLGIGNCFIKPYG